MKIFLTTIILFYSSIFNAQNTVIKLENKPEQFKVDKIGNVYVYHQQLLKKYSPQGKLQAQFSNFETGKLHSFDVSDPFRILLFYKDFNNIIFLDKQLYTIGNPIQLAELGFYSVSAVSKSNQMAIWLYDDFENKLLQYGFNPKRILQTIHFDGEDKQDINFMLEKENKLYLKLKSGKVLIYNLLGDQIDELDVNETSDFQIIGNDLIYDNGKNIFLKNPGDKRVDPAPLFDSINFEKVQVSHKNFYFLKSDSILIFERNEK